MIYYKNVYNIFEVRSVQLREIDKDKDYVLVMNQEDLTLLEESEAFSAQIDELQSKMHSLTIITDNLHLMEAKTIKYKILHENGKPLNRAHDDDVGFDITTAWVEPFYPLDADGKEIKDQPQSYRLHLGIAVQPPKGYYFELVPRSSFSKSGYVVGNSFGVIDPGYTGEIMGIIHPTKTGLPAPKAGDKHLQLVLHKYENYNTVLREVDYFESTARGDGGFGSTGK